MLISSPNPPFPDPQSHRQTWAYFEKKPLESLLFASLRSVICTTISICAQLKILFPDAHPCFLAISVRPASINTVVSQLITCRIGASDTTLELERLKVEVRQTHWK